VWTDNLISQTSVLLNDMLKTPLKVKLKGLSFIILLNEQLLLVHSVSSRLLLREN
jgi:hypothetical protein